MDGWMMMTCRLWCDMYASGIILLGYVKEAVGISRGWESATSEETSRASMHVCAYTPELEEESQSLEINSGSY